MTMQEHTANNIVVIGIAGRLEASTAPDFKSRVLELSAQGSQRFVLDLGQLRFMDSSGLGALVSALRQLGQKGGDIKLCGLSAEVKSLFMLTRLNKVFDIHETVQSALDAFS